MQRLWTPWRMRYVGGERSPGCVFCNALASPDDPDSLVLHLGEHAFMLLNRYPYNSGHLMIVPNQHAPSLEDITSAARAEMMELATLAMEAGRAVFRNDGFNLGLNIGDVAGAGIAEHLHMHLVPRWLGDANFMPILSDTMVIPEVLPTTRARMRAEIETILARQKGDTQLLAGGLVYLPQRREFALRRSRTGSIVLPRGHIEPGETAAEAAIREVREETGINAIITGWLGRQTVDTEIEGRRIKENIAFFVMTGEPADEFDAHLASDVILARRDELPDALDIPELRDVVQAALPVVDDLIAGL